MTTLEEYLAMTPWQRQQVNRQRVALGLTPYHALKGQTSHLKGKPSPRKGIKTGPNGTAGRPKPYLHGPKPHRWICGPDPELHKMYDPHLKAKAQAMYRGEDWTLTFDQFAELWRDQWQFRGRDGDDLCMTRTDTEKGWHRDNCEIVTRKEANARSGARKKGTLRRQL
jgi:hypothetical protein